MLDGLAKFARGRGDARYSYNPILAAGYTVLVSIEIVKAGET
jgi:hypothetical protein